MMKMMKPRLLVTLSPHLKRQVERVAEDNGCSQAEVVRTAVIKYVEV